MMSFTATDLMAILIATAATIVTGVLPAFALSGLLERLGLDIGRGWPRIGWTWLLGLAVFPALDAIAIRTAGLTATLVVHVALAVAGLVRIRRWTREQPQTSFGWPLAIMAFWFAIVALAYVDFDDGYVLHQSLIVVDLVKHAAVIRSIEASGLPLLDPFYARPSASGYYYYYYLEPTLCLRAGFGLFDARAAFAAALFWTAPALPALLWRVADAAGLIRPDRKMRFCLIATALCFVAGGELPFALAQMSRSGLWVRQLEWWSEEVRFAVGTALWVPHHLSALVAIWTAALLLDRARHATGLLLVSLIVVAGTALGSTFGMSVWIALAGAPILLVWALATSRNDGHPLILLLIAAGAVALILDAWQLLDIAAGRSDVAFPLGLGVRPFFSGDWATTPVDAIRQAALLPVDYLLAFGAFAIGTILFLRTQPERSDAGRSFRQLLVIAAIVALIEASFVRSTIINNDFGWRAIWFAQFPAMIWTATYLNELHDLRATPPLLVLFLLIGVSANLYDQVGLRLIRTTHAADAEKNRAVLAVSRAERMAYEWANAHLPADAVIQADPAASSRVFDFGLYGRNPTAVADHEAGLFGASQLEVDRRMKAVGPIFDQPIATAEVTRLARGQGIDYLMFSARDPAWQRRSGPPPGLPCVYRLPNLCLARASR